MYGGALKLSGQTLTIASSLFQDNTNAQASLIISDGSNITIYSTAFEGNNQSTAGAVSIANSSVLLVDATFLSNAGRHTSPLGCHPPLEFIECCA